LIPFLDLKAQYHQMKPEIDAAVLRAGANEIAVTFRSATRAADAAQAALPFPVPYAIQNCPIPNGNMLRKVQCDFGWDWNIALAPFGLYGAVRLVHAPLAQARHGRALRGVQGGSSSSRNTPADSLTPPVTLPPDLERICRMTQPCASAVPRRA